MFNGNVDRVGRTRLLAAVSKDGNRQLTVYSNAVDNKKAGNAMVLPVPSPASVQFHDLSAYKELFDDCEQSFASARSLTLSLGTDANRRSLPYLRVENVGSYQVSLANTLEDLKRADPSVFQLASGCEAVLRKYYSDAGWGFIICKIKQGSEEYHPFGYSHDIKGNTVFLPTRHYHGSSGQTFQTPMMNSGLAPFHSTPDYFGTQDDSFADDWDHTIYLYNTNGCNTDVKMMDSSKKEWNNTCKIQANKITGFTFAPLKNFRRITVQGNQPNIDITAGILA